MNNLRIWKNENELICENYEMICENYESENEYNKNLNNISVLLRSDWPSSKYWDNELYYKLVKL